LISNQQEKLITVPYNSTVTRNPTNLISNGSVVSGKIIKTFFPYGCMFKMSKKAYKPDLKTIY
jgi:hypothetical protein